MNKVFCPRCKSEDVQKESKVMDVMTAFGAPQKWICKNCGYSNYIFPEKEKIEEEK